MTDYVDELDFGYRCRPGTIYFAEFCAWGLLKIGWTSNLTQRLRYLASFEQTDVRLHGAVVGSMRDEKVFHRRLSDFRVGPDKQCETFRFCEETLAVIPMPARVEPRVFPYANRSTSARWHSPRLAIWAEGARCARGQDPAQP